MERYWSAQYRSARGSAALRRDLFTLARSATVDLSTMIAPAGLIRLQVRWAGTALLLPPPPPLLLPPPLLPPPLLCFSPTYRYVVDGKGIFEGGCLRRRTVLPHVAGSLGAARSPVHAQHPSD